MMNSTSALWRRAVSALSLFLASAAASVPGHAQEAGSFPSRPVKIVVPYAAGATTDILARTIAKTLEETWKQRVYVENQAGGGGLTGAGAVSRSAPDGHTLVVVTSAHVIGPTVMKKPPFDPIGAFAPITSLIQASTVLMSGPNSGIGSVKDLVAKAKGEELSYGSSGVGSIYHVTMAKFAQMSGAKLQHVPYRGTGPAMTDLMGGHLPLQSASIAFAKDFVHWRKGQRARDRARQPSPTAAERPDVQGGRLRPRLFGVVGLTGAGGNATDRDREDFARRRIRAEGHVVPAENAGRGDHSIDAG